MNLLEKITAPQTLIAFGIGTITGIVILHYGIKITPPKNTILSVSSVIGLLMDTSPILNLNVILLEVIPLGKMEG